MGSQAKREHGRSVRRRSVVTLAIVLATVMVAGSASQAATAVHRWRAEGNANDSVGTNHGTLINGATASGAPAEGTSSFGLDGINDRVEMPDTSTHYFSGSFTIEAWVKTTSTNLQWVVTKYECGGSCPAAVAHSFYRLGLGGNGAPFGDVRDSDEGGPDPTSSQGVSATPMTVADGSFHHLRFVRDVDADLLAIYVDGTLGGLEALHPGAAGPLANDDGTPDPLVVGAIYDPGSSTTLNSFFTGLIDDVQLFNEGTVAAEDFAPTLTDTDPDSPANDNSPEIKGSAIDGSTVKLYTTSDCSGTPVATGSAANFASPGLTVNVPNDSSTTFRATATVGTATSACSAPLTYVEQTTVRQPDGAIKRSKDATFLGDNTYNVTGAGQTALSKTKRGKKAVFNVVAQNDGNTSDTIVVTGCAKSRGFKVKYLDGTTDVTSQVMTTGYSAGTLAPGASKALVLQIKVKPTGPRRKTCAVMATSQSSPSQQDVVAGNVKVKG
jgi:hypothetical protein